MEIYFSYEYDGMLFELFGAAHLVTLLVLTIIALVLLRFKNETEKTRKKVRIMLGVFLWINESVWHIWNAAWGHWDVQTMLPLNACSILIWLGGFMLIFRNYTIYEFSYFMGIGGAFQYLMTPDLGIYGFPHIRFFQAFLSHGILLISAIYMTLVEGFRPTWKSLGKVAVGANLYMVVIYFVNIAIGSNYLMINGRPATPSLLDLLPDWPVYILYIEAIGLICCLLLYLPFIIKDLRTKKEAAA